MDVQKINKTSYSFYFIFIYRETYSKFPKFLQKLSNKYLKIEENESNGYLIIEKLFSLSHYKIPWYPGSYKQFNRSYMESLLTFHSVFGKSRRRNVVPSLGKCHGIL